MQGASGWLTMLKLRASYGVNGNNSISAYRAYGIYASTTYNGVTGMLPDQPANPNLSWEKNKTWNVGVDFGFFDNLHIQLHEHRLAEEHRYRGTARG